MRCPFLKEAQVKFCTTSAFRKMIAQPLGVAADEKCSSGGYGDCSVYKQQAHDGPTGARCPFLQESLVQYCGAASVTKFIPYSESLLCRCGSDAYRYCDLYVTSTHPENRGTASLLGRLMAGAEEAGERCADGTRIPSRLWYSANHLWLDLGEDRCCHVGIDEFLARILGQVERISFVTLTGVHHPTVVLTARGVDMPFVFPAPILLTGANLYLRASPARLTSDPYSLGWLFCGVEPPASAGPPLAAGLIPGTEAPGWMRQELTRLAEFLNGLSSRSRPRCPTTAGDVFSGDVMQHLGREEMLALFNEFFSPYTSLAPRS